MVVMSSTNTKRRTGRSKARTSKATTADIETQVVADLIGQIERGPDGTWSAPWHRKAGSVDILAPRNASTGKHYQGGNVFALLLAIGGRGYPVDEANLWATYRQWQALGSQVRRGEKGVQLVKWAPVTDRKTGEERLIPLAFTVFHHVQCDHDGWSAPVAPDLPEVERHDRADAWIVATGARILKGGDEACYRPRADVINLPEDDQFASLDRRLSVTIHELVHWTGHSKRLDRLGFIQEGHGKRSAPYALEELVAELGAAMACARFGLSATPRADHAQYLDHWIRAAGESPKALWQAASKASKAISWLENAAGVIGDQAE